MITINGIDYYTAPDLTKILNLKYPSVIALLNKYNAPKYGNKYIVIKELAEKIRNRENRTAKIYDISEDMTLTEILDRIKNK